MPEKHLGFFLKKIHLTQTVTCVLHVMVESARALGGDKFSYHPEIMFEGVASASSKVFAVGYSQNR